MPGLTQVGGFLVWPIMWAWLARRVVVAHPRCGSERYARGFGRAAIAVIAVSPIVNLLLGLGPVALEYWVWSAGAFIGAYAGWRQLRTSPGTYLGWRVWKWSVPEPPHEKAPFDWTDYLVITMVLVVGQWALAWLHVTYAQSVVGRQFASFPVFSVTGAEARAAIFGLFFLLSQFAIVVPARGLAKSLWHDWRVAEGSRHRRWVLLAAGAFPAALCLIPAVVFGSGAVLGSVLVRLGLLVLAFWATRQAPAELDAEFLSWGQLRTGRWMMRELAQTGR